MAYRFLLFTLMAGVAGCSTRLPQLQFATHITEDGYKLFQIAYPAPQKPIRLPGESTRQQKPINEKRWRAALDQTLEKSGYCREGYVLLGRYAGESVNRLRGECRELASTEDRQNFSDDIARW